MSAAKTIRIMLAEDQTLMRQGLRTIINLEPDLKVIAEAPDGKAAVKLAQEHQPDVILMDIQMPILNGVEATAMIGKLCPRTKIIILTTFDRDEYVFEAVRSGAMGFLLKDVPADILTQTIRKVHAGDIFIQPEIASKALRKSLTADGGIMEPLSDREREILIMIAQGIPNKEIADKLEIAEGTVKNHVSNILQKLQATNRTQAADIARRHGII